MKEKLLKQLSHSHSPYSHFRVSALLKVKDGCEFLGSNIENASYGASICAERVAITAAVSSGYRKGDFDSLYIMCDNKKIGMPCFLCRQVFTEFFEEDMPVIVMNPDGEEMQFTASTLCPFPFNEDDLK